MPLFINGYWPYPIEDILLWKERFERKGIAVNMVSVPFGHPGGSLGDAQNYDITPQYWPRRVDIDGNKFSGTSVLWNLSETKEIFTVKLDYKIQTVEIEGLDSILIAI